MSQVNEDVEMVAYEIHPLGLLFLLAYVLFCGWMLYEMYFKLF